MNIDNTIYFEILQRITGYDDRSLYDELKLYGPNNPSRFRKGREGEVQWITWETWAKKPKNKKHLEYYEAICALNKKYANRQRDEFKEPEAGENLTFTSHAYNVLLSYMQGEEIEELKRTIIGVLDEFLVEEKYKQAISEICDRAELAAYIVREAKDAKEKREKKTQKLYAEQVKSDRAKAQTTGVAFDEPPVEETVVNDCEEETESESETDIEEAGSPKMVFRKIFDFINANRRNIILTGLALLISLSFVVAGIAHKKRSTEEFLSIELYTSGKVSIDDFNESVKAIEERLDILAGGKYSISKTENRLALTIDKTVFKDKDPENILGAYVASPTNLFLLDLEAFSFYEFTPDCYAKIQREDIETINVCEGDIEGVDPADYELEGGKLRYIELTLTDEWVERNKHTQLWTDFVVAQDVTNDSIPTYDTIRKNEKTFCLIDEDGFSELAVHNYKNSPLPISFNVEVEYRVLWDDVEESRNPGLNQVNFEQLSGPTAQLIFASYQENRESHDFEKSEESLKKRLDLIGEPYAFGVMEKKGELFTVVRMSPANLGAPVIALLTDEYDIDLVCGLDSVRANMYDLESKIITDDHGSLVYQLSIYDPSFREKISLESLIAGNEGQPIMLCCEDMPILCIKPYYKQEVIADPGGPYIKNHLTYNTDGDKLNFYMLYANAQEKLSEETRFILEMLDLVLTDENNVSFFFDSYEFFPGQNGEKEKFGYNFEEDIENIKAMLPDFVPENEIYAIDGNERSWRICLDLPVDENLPMTALEAAKMVYESIDFEKQPLLCSIQIALIREDNSISRERGRIGFYKNYRGEVELSYVFEEGRLCPYEAQFEKLMKASEFYSKFSVYD